MVTVAGFGNPLLDYIVQINDKEILQKHNLNEDDAKEVTSQEVEKLLSDVKSRYDLSCSPGGCVQNTLRIMKWLMGGEHRMVMFGGVGNDANGALLEKLVTDSGVETRYAITDHQTGLMLSLVYEESRSLVGNIGAASQFTIDHLKVHEDFLKSAHLIYVEAFILSHGIGTASKLLELCTNSRIKLAFNLCAPYIIKEHIEEISMYVECSTVLFGNLREFQELARGIRGDENVERLVAELTLGKPEKLVVVTNGSGIIQCGYDSEKTASYLVPKLSKDTIVDTTGAGDSFVAGFLAAHLLNRSVLDCLKLGCWAARQIIGQVGCKPPPGIPTDIFNIMGNPRI